MIKLSHVNVYWEPYNWRLGFEKYAGHHCKTKVHYYIDIGPIEFVLHKEAK